MADTERIIAYIDAYLTQKKQQTTTPVEVNPMLERAGLLKDSSTRPGKPLRELLRKGKIPHAYQVGVNWFIPKSDRNNKKETKVSETGMSKTVLMKKVIKKSDTSVNKENKLKPIAELLIKLLKEKYKVEASYYLEYTPEWLVTYPTKELVKDWPELSELYSLLTGGQFNLDNKLSALTEKDQAKKQRYDIWIAAPFNFAVEFDEKQHFNQFRKITLGYYDKIKVRYPLAYYKELNEAAIIKPGKSGFTRLKNTDILFPELLEGDKQDNRIRQRAFRDFLKDLLPNYNACKPTLRIPYTLTSYKIKDFSSEDLDRVKAYILDNKLI